ncbi:sarcosine oxidase subunit gamma [Jannaschia aquimarina]|uniref:Sarcosine oxidase, gamma subunit family n=1 Tax=Jannaschia aquimarina TaxID=935700 RepID=A0A0D1EJK9_9RHOB|nr:sarcosine oxidase subunit gamma family protein [Jannaschia aquimarina]KIT15980.1 Sarcosine oxidase, gamma subunit family [Jannaschia aquimarina]SNS99227.1 sarcosine oxidase subunit gamma [Jannaschia aquimarina]
MSEITRVTDLGMITLRGDLATLSGAVEAATGCDAPDTRMMTASGDFRCLWMSPDELLVTCRRDDASELARRLSAALSDGFATVAEVTDARAVFDVSGPHRAAALAKLMPVDFAALAEAEVRRTRLAQVAAACWDEGDRYRVVCFRSVQDYVEAALRNAARGPFPAAFRA